MAAFRPCLNVLILFSSFNVAAHGIPRSHILASRVHNLLSVLGVNELPYGVTFWHDLHMLVKMMNGQTCIITRDLDFGQTNNDYH